MTIVIDKQKLTIIHYQMWDGLTFINQQPNRSMTFEDGTTITVMRFTSGDYRAYGSCDFIVKDPSAQSKAKTFSENCNLPYSLIGMEKVHPYLIEAYDARLVELQTDQDARASEVDTTMDYFSNVAVAA